MKHATHPAADMARLNALADLVEPLNRALPGPTEVVLHDLARLPDSIVAIAGQLSGRRPGGPATDVLLQAAVRRDFSTLVGYESELRDGRRIRSSTIIVPGRTGEPLAALCVNFDVSIWQPVQDFLAYLLPGGVWPGTPAGQREVPAAAFAGDVDELADHLLATAVAAVGVPLALMQKRHKLAVVDALRRRGFFLLREAPERAAAALSVTRFTIYNYLNELGEG